MSSLEKSAMFLDDQAKRLERYLAKNYTVAGLKIIIILVAVGFIVAAVAINNPIVLAALVAYIVLP